MKGFPFNSNQALAVWEGRQTVVRRPMKPQPMFNSDGCWYATGIREPQHYASEKHFKKGVALDFAPYSPGEVVYMQEPLNWESYASNGITNLCYVSDGTEVDAESPDTWNPPTNSVMSHWESGDNIPGGGFSWCNGTVQSIFMPQWASRLHLRLTVRPERLQDITEEGIKAEGITMPTWNPDSGERYPDPWEVFADLWYSIYGKTFPWKNNDWVWRYGLEEVWRRG